MATPGEAPRARVMGAREKRVAIRLLVCAIASQVGLECPAFAEAPPSEVLPRRGRRRTPAG